MIERNIDYVQVSLDYPQYKCRDNEYKIIAPVRFYKIGYQDESGVRYYYGNPNSKRALCILSGQALNSLRANGASDAEILVGLFAYNATCTRIDLAVTEYIDDNLIELSSIEAWYQSGKITSTLVSGGCKAIMDIPPQGERIVETLYIGDIEKRGSAGIFRAYDKGVEMDLEPFLITRLEIEDRGSKAMSTMKRIAQTDDIAGNFRARFDVNDPEFERLMQAPVAETTRGQNLQKRAEIDIRNGRWHWLINQVAPALRQAMKDDASLQLGDEMLLKFFTKSGITELIRETAADLARTQYYNYLQENGLIDKP